MSITLVSQGVRGKHSHTYASQSSAMKAIRRLHDTTGQLLIAIRPNGNDWTIQIGYPRADDGHGVLWAYEGQIVKV